MRGLRFKKKQLVEFLPRKKKIDFQSLARPDDFVRYGRRALVGLRADDVKSVSIERLCVCLSLSLHVEKPLNSKRWIKVSYLNQFREFSVFGFLYMFMNILGTLWLFQTSVYYVYVIECCFLDLFNIIRRILVQLTLSFFSLGLVSIHVIYSYCCMDTTAAWKKNCVLFHRICVTSI